MKLRAALSLLIFALPLTGCATTDGLALPTVDPHLLTCSDAPKVPADTSNSKQVANYIVDLHAAHADCKSKLGAVKKVLTP